MRKAGGEDKFPGLGFYGNPSPEFSEYFHSRVEEVSSQDIVTVYPRAHSTISLSRGGAVIYMGPSISGEQFIRVYPLVEGRPDDVDVEVQEVAARVLQAIQELHESLKHTGPNS